MRILFIDFTHVEGKHFEVEPFVQGMIKSFEYLKLVEGV